MVADIVRLTSKESASGLRWLAYWMGQDSPVRLHEELSVSTAVRNRENLSWTAESGKPPLRLLMPILEKLSLEATHFVLVLTNGLIIDLNDVNDSRWESRLLIYTNDRTVKVSSHIEHIMNSGAAMNGLDQARIITQHLRNKSGG